MWTTREEHEESETAGYVVKFWISYFLFFSLKCDYNII